MYSIMSAAVSHLLPAPCREARHEASLQHLAQPPQPSSRPRQQQPVGQPVTQVGPACSSSHDAAVHSLTRRQQAEGSSSSESG
jgi:hypothetical protein